MVNFKTRRMSSMHRSGTPYDWQRPTDLTGAKKKDRMTPRDGDDVVE